MNWTKRERERECVSLRRREHTNAETELSQTNQQTFKPTKELKKQSLAHTELYHFLDRGDFGF